MQHRGANRWMGWEGISPGGVRYRATNDVKNSTSFVHESKTKRKASWHPDLSGVLHGTAVGCEKS